MGCLALLLVYRRWWNLSAYLASMFPWFSSQVPSWWQWSSGPSAHGWVVAFESYWPSMFADTDHWLLQCERCHIAKEDNTEPKTQQGSLVAHQPLELLCVDFTKADIAKGGKENILVLTDAFSKFSQAFVTNNQKSLTVTKILIEKWFSIFGIPSWIHSNQGRSFDNEIISHLCKMCGICQFDYHTIQSMQQCSVHMI